MDEENKTTIHKISTGYDFDGTLNTGIIPVPDSVVLTGRHPSENGEVERYMKKNGLYMKVYYLPEKFEHTDEMIGKFKAKLAKKLGLETFYEDTPEVVEIMKREYSELNVILVNQTKFITISQGWDGLPVAYHIQNENGASLVGQVQSKKELGLEDDEKPDDKKSRLTQYDGMIKKFPARKVVNGLKGAKNRDDYFIFCDQNNLYKYAEELLDAGFTKGLFPLADDYEFEKDRERAMDFVEENYPDVKIIPFQTAKTVEEARALVEASTVPLVIQSAGDHVSTICPPDDVEINKQQIIAALEKYKADYAKSEIILKEKLIRPIEITPQIVFWDGKPVFTDIDIETKNIGDGENNGNQVGCGTNLIIKTDFEDKINKIAFPPKVHFMAKSRKGLFVWDISLYITEKGLFFGEFCSNRLGYDASLTEMAMSGGALAYFNAIMNGENPLKHKFGAAVRVFNLNNQKDVEISVEDEANTWLYEPKKDKERIVSTGSSWDLGVITGVGETPLQAIESVYSNYEKFSFKEKYARTKEDFLKDYPTSIAHRYKLTNNVYFSAPDWEDDDESKGPYEEKLSIHLSEVERSYQSLIKDMGSKHETEMNGIKDEIKSILNGDA